MLKDDILRLLKEDEEFRYAVVGLLGLQRLEEAISRLTDSNRVKERCNKAYRYTSKHGSEVKQG
jgi:hypothetical protein